MGKGWPSVRDQLVEADGMVVDLILVDHSLVTGVVIGVGSAAATLDRWDRLKHRPAGEPFILDLNSIAFVSVP